MFKVTKLSALVVLGLVIGAVPVFASTVTYTTLASFTGAATVVGVEDFESTAAGTVVAPGDGSASGTVGSLTFVANVADDSLAVVTGFSTTSGANYLGATNYNTFASQDNITITLPSSTAFGLYLLVGGPLAGGEFTLSAAGGTAVNSGTAEMNLGLGGYAYFIGLTSTTNFTTATLQVTNPAGAADGPYWNVDDIRWGTARSSTPPPPVPEPASLLLIGTGLVGVVRKVRKA